MRDATYVLLALMLSSLIAVFVQLLNKQKPALSMLELSEFKDLPYELRSVMRNMLPDSVMIRQQWKNFTPDQKHMIIQQIANAIPHPTPPPVPEPPVQKGIKRGFLNTIHKNKKKNPKDKKEDEVGTLAVVGSTEDVDGTTLTGDDTPFLGSDE
jgi:hypothetical protein